MNPTLMSLIVYGGVGCCLAAILFAVRDLTMSAKQDVSLRDVVRSVPSPSDQYRDTGFAQFDRWFDRSVYLSGLNMSSAAAMLLIPLVALLIGGAVFLATDDILLTVIAGLIATAACIAFLEVARRRTLKKFLQQFPDAIDLLARAVRSGESFDQAIELVGEAMKDPVANEFRRCARQLGMGLSVPVTLKALAYRYDLVELRLFASAVALHRDSGGTLPATLERLATVIRQRADYRQQLRNVTGASRFSVLVIATLGPLLFAYLFLVQPEYARALWEDPMGRALLVFAVISEFIGLWWVSRLLKPVM